MENSILNFHFVFRNPSLTTFWHYFKNRLKQSFFEFFLFQVFDVYCHSNVSPSSLHSEVPTENVQCCKISMLVLRLYKLLLEAGKQMLQSRRLELFSIAMITFFAVMTCQANLLSTNGQCCMNWTLFRNAGQKEDLKVNTNPGFAS